MRPAGAAPGTPTIARIQMFGYEMLDQIDARQKTVHIIHTDDNTVILLFGNYPPDSVRFELIVINKICGGDS